MQELTLSAFYNVGNLLFVLVSFPDRLLCTHNSNSPSNMVFILHFKVGLLVNKNLNYPLISQACLDAFSVLLPQTDSILASNSCFSSFVVIKEVS